MDRVVGHCARFQYSPSDFRNLATTGARRCGEAVIADWILLHMGWAEFAYLIAFGDLRDMHLQQEQNRQTSL